ncbi:MAG: hypothetical protein HOM80_16275 [Bacteroidetes bacterium]|nr:hypothetical protein [Bacteroidota bacterium]
MPKKDEAMLMFKIEKELYPDRDVKLREVSEEEEIKVKELKYSPPLKQLVDEHVNIMQVIYCIPDIIELIGKSVDLDKNLVLNTVRFIQEYADKYHHAKEEDILFDYADKSLEIINVIKEDHTTSRNHMKAVIEAVERGDKNEIANRMTAYAKLLTEHIKKEDEILYPWIDRSLTTTQVGELFQKFSDSNNTLGRELPKRNLDFMKSLQQMFEK